MKKCSMLGSLFRHPLKVFNRTILIWFLLCFILEAMGVLNDSTISLSLVIGIFLALKRVQKTTNKELMILSQMNPNQKKAYKKSKRNSSLFMRLFRFANAPMNMFNDHTQKEMEKAVYQWFKGNDDSEYQRMRAERDRQANERARKRWNALDMQKKAEWDVKDMAKRGKDIGAAQRANDVRYWKNEYKKY